MGGRCERAVQRSRWWGQRSLVRNKELPTVSVLVLKRRLAHSNRESKRGREVFRKKSKYRL